MAITQRDVEELYINSAVALDEGDFVRWASFFATKSSYQVITRDNFERGMPLAVMSCETKGMIDDRIAAIGRALYYLPRRQRRMMSSIRITKTEEDRVHASASVVVFESVMSEPGTIYTVGVYQDVLAVEEGALRFVDRKVILDSAVIQTSIPFPL